MSMIPQNLSPSAAKLAVDFYTAKLGTFTGDPQIARNMLDLLRELVALLQDKIGSEIPGLSDQEKKIVTALREKVKDSDKCPEHTIGLPSLGLWRFTDSLSGLLGKQLTVADDGTFTWLVTSSFTSQVKFTGKFGDVVTVDDEVTIVNSAPMTMYPPTSGMVKTDLLQHLLAQSRSSYGDSAKFPSTSGHYMQPNGNPFMRQSYQPMHGAYSEPVNATDIFVSKGGLELINTIVMMLDGVAADGKGAHAFYIAMNAGLTYNRYKPCMLLTSGHEPRLGYRDEQGVIYPADSIWELAQAALREKFTNPATQLGAGPYSL